EQVRLAGGVPVPVQTRPEDAYVLDPEALRAAVTDRTKIIVLNSPGNPTGALFPEPVIRAVAELAAERNLIVISDEIYEHITYGSEAHVSPARFAPENVLTVNGASKAFAMTGWRIGFAAGPAWLIKAMNGLQGQVTTNASTPAQYAALEALRDPDGQTTAFIDMARTAFERRRDLIVKGLNDLGLATPVPSGAFYALADATRIRPNEVDAARLILDEGRVAVVPGTDFDAPGRVRFSYACSEAQIEEVLARLRAL
ncbi:MAG TPA: aminotransferase class I/II-fold pyridoxal phosphate-dependent enzyme, partial [Deinococcales bacterium]|nr:aminotransferase class I/II-fold pyridoxal phosphate-dependent enzyme [Deinococcales bacterium]